MAAAAAASSAGSSASPACAVSEEKTNGSRLALTDLQEKTDRLVGTAGVVGLKINPRKTKTLGMNHRCTDYIRIKGEEVEHVES